jgi:hypothetical protein
MAAEPATKSHRASRGQRGPARAACSHDIAAPVGVPSFGRSKVSPGKPDTQPAHGAGFSWPRRGPRIWRADRTFSDPRTCIRCRRKPGLFRVRGQRVCLVCRDYLGEALEHLFPAMLPEGVDE